MKLSDLKPKEGSKKSRKRVGRGYGSGNGKTSGRGMNGQNSRSGGGVRPGFEGGQMPLMRRIPKRGFSNSLFKNIFRVINIFDIESNFQDKEVVTLVDLHDKGFVNLKKGEKIKLLGNGEIGISKTIEVNAVSNTARVKVEKVKGKIEVVC